MASSEILTSDRAEEQGCYPEVTLEDVPHLAELHFSDVKEPTSGGNIDVASGSLPYGRLGGAGFERLCFHLLLAEGEAPRFWGRSGQAQQGIDLILSDGAVTTVFQCKNYAYFSAEKLQEALDKFELEWLNKRPNLGKPNTFVLCTSAELNSQCDWHECKLKFWKNTGVHVQEWSRDVLDGKLREQPGIVADLFGDHVAELFCGRGRHWDLGLFRPLSPDSGDKRVDRFVELQDAGRIIRLDDDARRFDAILGKHPIVLVGGLAGTGKTMTALDLASAFDNGSWRVFYLRPDETQNVDHLVEGIKHRAFRKTLFVLDDCQFDFQQVEVLQTRLRNIKNRSFKLILTARTPPDGMDFLDPDGTLFVQEMQENDQFIEIVADADRFRAITARRRPEWRDPPIDRLMAWTGHDLAILDIVLDTTAPEDFRGVEKLEDLFQQILREVFQANTANAPNLKRLAAIAQFDAKVPQSLFPEPFERSQNNRAAERFVVVGGRPAAMAFSHPSAAELMFRLLAWAHGEVDIAGACARDCAKILVDCEPDYALIDLLPRLLHTRLKLGNEQAIRQALLTDSRVLSLLEREHERVPVQVLSSLVFYFRNLPSPLPFVSWLTDRLEDYANNSEIADTFRIISRCLRSLALADAAAHRDIEMRIGVSRFAALIVAQGTLIELLRVLPNCTAGFAIEILGTIQAEQMAALVGRAIGDEKSIGTLHLALRELATRPLPSKPGRTQLHLFEKRLGRAAMASLIAAHGTLIELLRVLQYCTAGFAIEILGTIQAEQMAALVKRTIGEEKSISTLSFALRELATRPLPGEPGRTQLHLFEERLGGAAMASLITARGTLVELLSILKYSTEGFAIEILGTIQAEQMAALVKRTIGEEKSISTLSFALRELATRPLPGEPGRTQLHLFEERLGTGNFWRLVTGVGNFNHLSFILNVLSPTFRQRVLDAKCAPSSSEWLAFAHANNFYGLARFARDSLAMMPNETAKRFQDTVEATATSVAEKSTWKEIGAGLAAVEEVSDVTVRTVLLAAADRRLDKVDIASFEVNGDYETGTGLLSLLWRERPNLHPQIGAALWRMLPDEMHWPRTYRLLVQAHFVLVVARSSHVADEDALRVLKAFAPLRLDIAIDPRSARYHALFLWNLYALWFERGRGAADAFRKLQDERIWERFISVVTRRLSFRRNEDKLETLQLAGALAWLVPEMRSRVAELIRGKIVGIRYLADMADDDALGFVPAFVALYGMTLCVPENTIFSPERVQCLLEKAEKYTERGPALVPVLNWLNGKLRRHQPRRS